MTKTSRPPQVSSLKGRDWETLLPNILTRMAKPPMRRSSPSKSARPKAHRGKAYGTPISTFQLMLSCSFCLERIMLD